VIDAESKEGIENIRVVIPGDTTKTDSEGKYQIDVQGFPVNSKYEIQFQDIDGALNGEFQDLDTEVEFKDSEFTDGDGHWYYGETSKELNIELNKKK
jgi:putative lipoprotein (rSAM/lipoprotein system)